MEIVERVVEAPVAHERTQRREEWPALLREPATQLDDGRIYARDLPSLGCALNGLAAAIDRRQNSAQRPPLTHCSRTPRYA